MVLQKLFSRTNSAPKDILEIFSPLDAKIIELSEVPDKYFSAKLFGDGVALLPEGDIIHAPCDIKDVGIFETNHTISFEKEGLNIIIHFGIDTVRLHGKGFERICKNGANVKKGDKLVQVDLNYLKSSKKSIITPVLIADTTEVEITDRASGEVKKGDLLFKVKLNRNTNDIDISEIAKLARV